MIRVHIITQWCFYDLNTAKIHHPRVMEVPNPTGHTSNLWGKRPLYSCNATDRLISWEIHYCPLWTVLRSECLRIWGVKALNRQIDQHVLILLYISGCAFMLTHLLGQCRYSIQLGPTTFYNMYESEDKNAIAGSSQYTRVMHRT